MVKTWQLKTPYGTINAVKSRSYGERVWRPLEKEKEYGSAYFNKQGQRLNGKQTFAHIGKEWIPASGNDKYAKAILYDDWVGMGKPMTIEGKKLGLVVKKLMMQGNRAVSTTGEADVIFKAGTEIQIAKVELKRYVTTDSKYIIPEPSTIDAYNNIVSKLTSKGTILITDPVRIQTNSGKRYVYGIVPNGKYLLMIELLNEDSANPFPPDALIPSDNPQEIGDLEDEDVTGLI